MSTPSLEQQLIIQGIQSDNVIVDAVAGSGKTTTVINLGQALPDLLILLITYSSRLKDECRSRVGRCNLDNVEVRSFHSLYNTYYGECHNDAHLQDLIKRNKKLKRSSEVDIIVVDEVQDMDRFLFLAVEKFIRDVKFGGKLMIMGDIHQNIFSYRGSDIRFLTRADEVFKRSFNNYRLSTSFRLTPPMCYFLNEVVLGEGLITSGKDDERYPPVEYYRGNLFKIHTLVGNMISKKIRSQEWKVEDIFVVANTTKHPGLKKIANILTQNGVKIYHHGSDDYMIDERLLANKVALLNFHKCKGLERPVVIVCGFDTSYFRYIDNPDTSICPEIFYVALTRASHQLIVVNGYDDSMSGNRNVGKDMMPFINLENLRNRNFIKVINLDSEYPLKISDGRLPNKAQKMDVTKLVKHLSTEISNNLDRLVQPLLIRIPSEEPKLNMPLEVIRYSRGKKLIESVANINAVSITLRHQNELRGQNPQEPGYYLKRATRLISEDDHLAYYLVQIPPYDWLENHHLEEGTDRLNRFLTSVDVYTFDVEEPVGGREVGAVISQENNLSIKAIINGKIDILHLTDHDSAKIIEIKCVQEVTLEHLLQVITYAYLWRLDTKRKNISIEKIYLYSIITDEIIEIKVDEKTINKIMNILVVEKFGPSKRKTDSEFFRSLKI